MKILHEALNAEPILKYSFLLIKWSILLSFYLLMGIIGAILGLLFGGDADYASDEDNERKKRREQERKIREEEHHRLGGQLQWEQDHPR